ncbi:hypothetical protein DRN84_00830 [Candidatus Geothermarchaeota archaeon]|nr:MAG: hypothetical protein DRN84_00830 [Candidatus Geothermarchaeota archaeon]HEW94370.1 hypothetical protein [Thermoprotei archaeon]
MKIIDIHVHDPYIFEVHKPSPEIVAEELLSKMDAIGIEKIFLYALEADPSKIYRELDRKEIYKGVEDAINKGIYHIPKIVLEGIEKTKETRDRHINVLKAAYTPTERVVKISKYSGNRILPVGSIRLEDKSDYRARLHDIFRLGIYGLKLYPTVQFIEPSSRKLYKLYDELERRDISLFIHTGCDPGLWELPRFCRYADPINVRKIADKYPKLKIVLCHMGAYSALKPGIFVDKAIELVNSYDNVYGDLAALDFDIIKYIVKRVKIDKILFGSDYPVTGLEWYTHIRNILNLDIPNHYKNMILYENAVEIFNL